VADKTFLNVIVCPSYNMKVFILSSNQQKIMKLYLQIFLVGIIELTESLQEQQARLSKE
jgi:hypothetical protein